ncbi:glycerophosphoryl diester phosphodiesterase [Cohnella lupini]|uniref:Glycerophosphoryl diester phosphodiesterase n=1 Tax=Cohnella lupini TaxID=1294267 RepID=A0A3D9IV27_9BACL|nr:glycerophosphoryl diester phosphodiesterase [Cohnella lupini]
MWQGIKHGAKGLVNLPFRFPTRGVRVMNLAKRAALHPCVAHRGFSGQAPENTMAAFRLALSQSYVSWMELDVHLSRDEVPVVIHDGTLKRTTNGQGRVKELTAKELGVLDAGSWFHPSFSAEGVPTLDEVIAFASGSCRLNIELKGDYVDRDLLARRAVEVIRARQIEQEVVITSFQPDILEAVRRHSQSVRTGLIIDDRPADLIKKIKAIGADYLSIGFRSLNERLLQQTAESSIDVMAWTVNSVSDLRRLSSRPEPFQICTNYPDRWYAVMKEENGSHE